MHPPFGVIACVLALAWGHVAAAPRYAAAPLGALGGEYSRAFAINSLGQITGESQLAGGAWHAFLWTEGVMRDLDTLGSAVSVGKALNASGHVVGCAKGSSGDFAFQHDGERMQDLRAVTGDDFLLCATGINDAGHVVGTRWSPFPPSLAPSFLRVDGAMEDIWQAAAAINNRGDLAGTANRHLNPPMGWVRVAGVYLTAYPQLDWSAESHVTAINDNGRAVGVGSPSGGPGPAFIFENGVRTDLDARIEPAAINNHGAIVGATSTDGRAVLYVEGIVHDLNALVVSGLDGAILTDAVGINDAGVIVANSCWGYGPPLEPPYPWYPRCMAYRLLPLDTAAPMAAPVPAHSPAALIVVAVALVISGVALRRR